MRSYPVNDDGSLGEMTVRTTLARTAGSTGWSWTPRATSSRRRAGDQGGPGSSVYVFAPDGEVIERHPVPVANPTNCTFGGDDLSTLYVTSIGGYLLRVETERQGRLHYPAVG